MESEPIQEFAKTVVQLIRDESVLECDVLRNLDATTTDAKHFRQLIDAGQIDDLLAHVIAECVDITLFSFLHYNENEHFDMSFVSQLGIGRELRQLRGSGGLDGWFIGDWRQQFSRERFYD